MEPLRNPGKVGEQTLFEVVTVFHFLVIELVVSMIYLKYTYLESSGLPGQNETSFNSLGCVEVKLYAIVEKLNPCV